MGKKGRKGNDDWEKDFELDESGELKALKEEVEAPAPKPKKEKKGKKDKKGGKKAAAFDSDDEDEPKLGLPPAPAADEEEAEEEDEEEEEEPVNHTKQKAGGKKKKKGGAAAGGSVFALLGGGSDEEAADEEEDEEEAEEEEAPAARKPVLCVAEVLSVAPHPKADRLRVCQVDAGGVSTVKIVTNAQNVEEGMKVVLARVGSTTRSGMLVEQAALRGVDSFGMLCSAYECGWVSEPDGVLVVMPEDAEVGEECPEEPPEGAIYGASAGKKDKKEKEKKKEKKKKGAVDDSLFAALAGEDGEAAGEEAAEVDEEEEAPRSSKKDKKKGKKGAADTASLFAALSVEDGEAAEDPEEAEGGKTEKKKKDKKKKVADADSLFAMLGGEEDAPAEEQAPAAKKEKKKGKKAYADVDVAALLAADEEAAEAPAPASGKKGKKDKKKGKAAAADDEEDLDALLAELDGPKAGAAGAAAAAQAPAAEAPAAAAAAGGKKDKKKKGKGGAKEDDEEDLDALLAELGAAPGEQQAAAPAAGAAQQQQAGQQQQGARPETPEGEEGEEEGEGDGKEMSAAAKRKAKKKAKEKAKKAAVDGEAEAEEAAAAAAAPAAAGKGGKKVSAAVRRMQEALEAQRKAQEEAERLAEEQRLKEEEEERLREEEEARKKEEAERKKREKAERREQLKREGKLLTGKAKEEAERRARAAEQFLKQAGINPDELPKKKPVYGSKKKPQKKKPAAEEAAAAAAAEPAAAEAAPAEAAAAEAAPMEAEPAPAAAAEEAAAAAEPAAVDSWEDAADDWEAMDVDQIKLPGQQAEEDAEEEEEEEAPPPKPAVANGKAKTAAAAASAKAAAAVKAAEDAVAAARAAVEEEEEGSEEEEESEEESSSEEGSSSEEDSSDEDSSDYSSSEEESDSEDERERRLAAARERREAKLAQALAARDPKDLRSPICCILGHVDTGKTKILDNIRRTNVQDGEAGGITQQIGATYIPASAVETRTEGLRKGRQFDLKLPGLLVIDTPGHESFSNLRSRGSGLCDIAILVVDLMHGLEQQTIESINLLKMRKTPFIIAMNKVDRLYNWASEANSPIQDAMARQPDYVKKEFDDRLNQVCLQLNEQGLNVALYWKNKDPRSFINIVPTSAITGEGIPDLLQLVVKLTQSLMVERLMFVNNLECTVLEVKQIEGLGTTIDVVLVNGMLREGDTIVVCGLGGPIVTTIRALLTPQPLREIRVKGQYIHHKELRAAMGVKIAAHNLESAVAGTQLYVAGPEDDVEDLKDAVMEDMQDIFSSVDKTGEGVCVQASTLGSLEALLEFLKSDDVRIPVSSINIGPINKKDVMRANAMIERGYKKFGVILAFDVPVTREAATLAEQLGVRIFTADIIYHLFDQFTAYLKQVKEEEQEAAKLTAVFPCVLKIIPTCIFNQKDPIILGVEVVEGIAKVGTPICVPTRGGVDLGRIASLEKDHKAVDTARRGDSVAMKIESTKPEEASRSYERHFDHRDELVSRITRKSINVLKEMFRDELSKDDWRLVIKLKKIFKID